MEQSPQPQANRSERRGIDEDWPPCLSQLASTLLRPPYLSVCLVKVLTVPVYLLCLLSDILWPGEVVIPARLRPSFVGGEETGGGGSWSRVPESREERGDPGMHQPAPGLARALQAADLALSHPKKSEVGAAWVATC